MSQIKTKTSEYESEVKKFISDLKNKELGTSTKIALASVSFIKKFIGESKWQTANDLLKILREEEKKLFEKIPTETIVKNIWKRVIKIVKDESINPDMSNHVAIDSLQGNLFASNKQQNLMISDSELKPIMIEAISEIKIEIETSVQNIANQSLEHIHANEVILTMGKSQTVEAFLKNAARKRKFHVIIVENEPYLDGHELASNLHKVGLDVTLITDSAIFTIISRVNTIIIGTYSIFANGGLKGHPGTHSLALAAKHHNIPLIVCSSLFKLSPEYFANSNNLPSLLPPDDVLSAPHPYITVLNPSFDYVPPELITLFIFNTTKNAPSYVYRILREMYPIDDEVYQ
jgi:translation initiation factor eIF-2B subunit beta